MGSCEGVQGSAQTHFASACKDQFHGDGTVSGVYSSTDKDNVFHNVSYTGTYTVNPDCTGTSTINVPGGGGPSFDLFIAPDGSELATFATAPAGNQLASIDRRVSRK